LSSSRYARIGFDVLRSRYAGGVKELLLLMKRMLLSVRVRRRKVVRDSLLVLWRRAFHASHSRFIALNTMF
jgi:hypothetical protein